MTKLNVDLASLLLRLGVGLIFIPHGYSKVFGEGGAAAFAQDMPGYGIPAVFGYAAAYAEFFGAALLIAGLLTRLDAFLLAITMFVAAFVVQLPDALNDVPAGTPRIFAALRGMELPLSLFVASVAIMLIGPGRLSLDALLGIETRLGRLVRRKETSS